MGTDIHGIFQRHDAATGKWLDVESKFDENRHYQLFAVLADVRNGYGFAGVSTGEAVKPIARPRGFPADFEVDGEDHPVADVSALTEWQRKYHKDGDPLVVWMGDHSHSWLTAEEMLAWYATAPTVLKTGVISREQYGKWDGKSSPDSWSGGISGPGVVVVNDNDIEKKERPAWTHVQIHWESGLKEELRYFFDEVTRLATEHRRVRYVFGFDS